VSELTLAGELSRALGRPVELHRRRSWTYRSSFAIEQLELSIEGAEPVRLLLKELDAAALSDVAVVARPAFLRDAVHEAAIYREVLPALGHDVPRLYGSAVDTSRGRSWLLLEQIEGVPLWQVGEAATWDAAARWLAALHAAEPPVSSALRRYDDAWHRRWLQRALQIAPRGALARVEASHQLVVGQLAAWPKSLIHGEFFPSNVLVEHATGAPRLRVVDWEMAGIGAGLLDLAALTAGWPQQGRDRLVAVYHEAWIAAGGRASFAQLEVGLEHARLQNALQWIGWSSDWRPPTPHACDWLTEAQRSAELLEL
jgi:aminoglycoside phosphotransferase (APT) family kinase protein